MKRKSETMTVTVATRKQYSETTIKWAEQMLLSGVAPSEVARQTGIDGGYARTLKFRLGAKEIKIGSVTDSEILREVVALKPITEKETPTKEPATMPEFWKRAVFQFSPYDLVYYVVAGVCCVGIVSVLETVGLAVAFCYFGVSVIALQRCKEENENSGSEVDLGAVIFLECLVSIPFDLAWVNGVLWQNVKALPFRVEGVVVDGVQDWSNGAVPFWIALYISVLLAATAIYSCFSTLKLAKRRAKNATK